MDSASGLRARILETITLKSNLQQRVFDNTFAALTQIKEILHEMDSELDDELEDKIDERVRIEYRDRGKFEAQIQIASDILIFSMHTNIFSFPPSHPVCSVPYAAADRSNTFCGVINIYNFLSDSIKNNRSGDEGYLIGRVLVNADNRFFVEGRCCDFAASSFGQTVADEASVRSIVEGAIDFALNFEPLIPPYDVALRASVEQFNTRFENSKIPTGKRLGYDLDIDGF